MIKKISVLFFISCFFSNVLYAQTFLLDQQNIALTKLSIDNIANKLDSLIEQLDKGEPVNPDDIKNMINELKLFNDDINETLNYANSQQSGNKEAICGSIKLISLVWMGIGATFLLSLLSSILSLVISQANPPETSTISDSISLIRQYMRIARKAVVSFIIVPISAINILLTSIHYRDCMNTDF